MGDHRTEQAAVGQRGWTGSARRNSISRRLLASAPAAAKPAPTNRAKVAPRPIPSGLALVNEKIRPTSAAPRVCPTSRALARMPLVLPARSGGALAKMARLLGD